MTHARNRHAIETWQQSNKSDRLKFLYIPLFDVRMMPFGTLGRYLYYYLWQMAALIYLTRTRAWKEFDLIHHLTYGGIRTGSFLFLVPGRFMFGPVGGGEIAPLAFSAAIGRRYLWAEIARLVSNGLSRFDPILLLMQARAERILVRTPETGRCMLLGAGKTFIRPEIGAPSIGLPAHRKTPSDTHCRLLFAGRLLYWKGIDILIDALRHLDDAGYPVVLDVIGDGERKHALSQKVARLRNIKVNLHGNVPQLAVFEAYRDADLFVFPSLHDSGGTVVLEALAAALPVICLNLGGPPVVGAGAVLALDVKGMTYDGLCRHLATVIQDLCERPSRRAEMAAAGLERAAEMQWVDVVREGYGSAIMGLS